MIMLHQASVTSHRDDSKNALNNGKAQLWLIDNSQTCVTD